MPSVSGVCYNKLKIRKFSSRNRAVSYSVRLMRREDIAHVTEIDHEAFSTIWPVTNYQHELQNRLAHYIVAIDEERAIDKPDINPEKGFSRLVSKVRHLFDHNRFFGPEIPPAGKQYIIGFTGFWLMAGEAHITNIAVRETYQRQGIGELLLISAIEMATKLKTHLITLEARISNTAAQSLYSKYGFTQTGLRRGYYTDNKEDAVSMSTENIASTSFQACFQQLKQDHSRKWGIASCQIIR